MVDKEGRILIMLAGSPKDEADWKNACARCAALLEETRGSYVEAKDANKRRGDYASVSAGISFGGGQKVRSCRV